MHAFQVGTILAIKAPLKLRHLTPFGFEVIGQQIGCSDAAT